MFLNLRKVLEIICQKASARDKKQRYRSANQMAIDLHRFLQGKNMRTKKLKTRVQKKRELYTRGMTALLSLPILELAYIFFVLLGYKLTIAFFGRDLLEPLV